MVDTKFEGQRVRERGRPRTIEVCTNVYIKNAQASSPANCTACARKRTYIRLNALQQRDLPAASDDRRAVDTRVGNQGETCSVNTYYEGSYPYVGSTD